MDKGIHAFFSGMVQGVGFRFTTRMLANRHKIKGWVRNTPNGKVEMMAEGEKERLNEFLDDLRSEFQNYISDVDIKSLQLPEKYQDFQIKF